MKWLVRISHACKWRLAYCPIYVVYFFHVIVHIDDNYSSNSKIETLICCSILTFNATLPSLHVTSRTDNLHCNSPLSAHKRMVEGMERVGLVGREGVNGRQRRPGVSEGSNTSWYARRLVLCYVCKCNMQSHMTDMRDFVHEKSDWVTT